MRQSGRIRNLEHKVVVVNNLLQAGKVSGRFGLFGFGYTETFWHSGFNQNVLHEPALDHEGQSKGARL